MRDRNNKVFEIMFCFKLFNEKLNNILLNNKKRSYELIKRVVKVKNKISSDLEAQRN